MKKSECIIYPGQYTPMSDFNEIAENMKSKNGLSFKKALVNIVEMNNLFKIEMAMPGVKREDIFVEVEEGILSVCVLHQLSSMSESNEFKTHEFDATKYTRQIVLPQNIEHSFVSASYHDGILSIYFPKLSNQKNQKHATIAVY